MNKTPIMGKAVATADQMAEYLLARNPNPKIDLPVKEFCRLFLYMGALEGVRGDGLFAQSCWETNDFTYTGTVTPDQNNFSGLGTTSATEKGVYFPDSATGMLAQAQHAKTYATKNELNYDNVDPRRTEWFVNTKGGTAQNWEDLGGSWAVPGYDTGKYSSLDAANAAHDSYGYKIVNILNEILAVGKEEEIEPEIPFDEPAPSTDKPLKGIRICLDAGHYGKYNRSPGVPEYYESDMAWKLQNYLKSCIEELGGTVITTRPNQATDKALKARGQASRGCHAFLSLHSNAVGGGMNEATDYIAVYHLVDDVSATCDDISKELAKVIAPVIGNVMQTKQGYKILTRKSANDLNGDGVMNDNYYGVLNGARSVDTPGLILEHSFHTNTAATRWLLSDSNLERLAWEEAKALALYFSGKKVEDKESEATGLPYTIRVANVPEGDVLNIRSAPNASAAKTGALAWNDPNRYTIVAESNGWGKLKSGIGWINLKYTVDA